MPPVVDLGSVRRVLILKLSAMGDVLHALPVSAALGEAFPHLELTWAVEEPFASLLSGNPYLSEVLTFPKLRGSSLKSVAFRRDYVTRLRAVRQRKFDVTLDLQGLTKSAVIAAAAGAKVRLGYHWLRELARLIETPVPRRPESVHIVDQYLDVARALGADPTKVKFPFDIPEADSATVEAMLCAAGIPPESPFISINPAAGHPLKLWGAENYAALMDRLSERLHRPSVLVTADRAVAAEVGAAAQRPFVDLSGKTNLKQLASVLQRSTVHVCGDTGSGHIAAALERPVVSLIGPTDPDRACPYGQRQNVLTHRELCGTKCTWHHCEFARPRCLNAITVEEVAARVEQCALDSDT